ncbi:MAG: entericidin A/B family lipoprotein [Sphingomonadaceae bacterium]
MLQKLMMFLLVLGGLAVTACNTVEGVGRDVESVGEATQEAAN